MPINNTPFADSYTETDSRRPIELYEFTRSGKSWRYTSAARDVTHQSRVYQAVPIQRSPIEQSNEIGRATLKINISKDAKLVQPFIYAPPTSVTSVKLIRIQDGIDQQVTLWLGRILNVSFESDSAEISCEPVYTSIIRTGLRRFYQIGCPHPLYGVDCRASAASFKDTGQVIGVNGNVVSIQEAGSRANGWYAGGYLTYRAGAERFMILSHTGVKLTLTAVPHGLNAGDDVDIYPGCDHTLNTCKLKFNNLANYGGYPYMPDKNPFNTAVY